MAAERHWKRMDTQPRRPMTELTKAEIPLDPGVYAVYRDGRRMYVGKAKSLKERVWGDHSGRGMSMRGSAFRRNVAEHLGIASANDIYKKLYRPSEAEVGRVRDWIDGCEVTWLTCSSEQAAINLEDQIKSEFLPPLTKR